MELGDIGGPNETGRFSGPKNIRHLLNSPWATGILSVFGVFGEPYDTIRNKKTSNIDHPQGLQVISLSYDIIYAVVKFCANFFGLWMFIYDYLWISLDLY